MKDNDIGMVAFFPTNTAAKSTKQEQMGGYPLIVQNKLTVKVGYLESK